MDVSGGIHAPAALPAGTYCIGDLVDPRASLNGVE
jgi:hypothetical protein